MYFSTVNNLSRKITPQNWKNLMTSRKLASAEVGSAKSLSNDPPRNITYHQCICGRKLKHVLTFGLIDQNLFRLHSVNSRFNLIRRYSTKETEEQKNEKILTFVNIDLIFSIAFLIFLYIDYKKYKEKGQSFVFAKL